MLLHQKKKKITVLSSDVEQQQQSSNADTSITAVGPTLVKYACALCGGIVELGVGDPIHCSHGSCNSRVVTKLRSEKPLEYISR